ncbi:endonuclease [Haemophilus sp. CCUG 66565]|uniref:P22AR C-terminal domain-containing protein n=1 Tax=Haemophilus sp. CCUG 66565 TaxID=1859694 RepID=UPI00080359AD|nr:P22AR C-terminal domain-containing protein [Haemophilus sp. CCUG 66565]OBX86921.1 endonuclease [Haemophilus sp. CCUG 66565]
MTSNAERFKFTDEHIAFIRLHWDKKPSDLIKLFQQQFDLLINRNVFYKLKKKHNIPSLKHANRYSKEELAFIKANCTLNERILAQKMEVYFNKPFNPHALKVLRVKRQWLTGRSGRFEKGENLKPIGFERYCENAKCWLIKASIKRYERKSHYLWRKAGRKIPRGHIIDYKDGNSRNCTLENLELISRVEMAWRKKLQYHQLNDEIKPTFSAFVKLKEGINQRKKEKDMEENQSPNIATQEPTTFTFEFTEYELQELAWLWFAFKRGVGTFQHIERAFNVLGSNMSGQIYGQAYEYLSVLRSTNQILNRITSDFNIDQMTNWRVLKHLRGFNPKAVKIDF